MGDSIVMEVGGVRQLLEEVEEQTAGEEVMRMKVVEVELLEEEEQRLFEWKFGGQGALLQEEEVVVKESLELI